MELSKFSKDFSPIFLTNLSYILVYVVKKSNKKVNVKTGWQENGFSEGKKSFLVPQKKYRWSKPLINELIFGRCKGYKYTCTVFDIILYPPRLFEKKNSKWPTQKNWVFQPPPKAEQFSPKFHRLVLGLVGLIDAKGINVTQPILPSGCPT